MKSIALWCLFALAALALGSCRDEPRVTVVFTGDDHAWIVPAG